MTDRLPTLSDAALRRALVMRLAPLTERAEGQGPANLGVGSGGQAFSYRVDAREQIRRARFDEPSLVVVVRGAKEFWRNDLCQRFGPGEPFLVPADTTFDMVNIPDERVGRFESVLITVDAPMRRALRQLAPAPAAGLAGLLGMGVELTADLVGAYGHAATVLVDDQMAARLARHRLLEVLLVASASPAARPLFSSSLLERVRDLVAEEAGRDWRLADLADALSIGPSTLRRRLSAEGTSFRQVLLRARMNLANTLLGQSDASVGRAAQAAGYRSRSHFARRFRNAYGVAPREVRGGD